MIPVEFHSREKRKTKSFSLGVCCAKGEKYAIYVISVCCKPLHPYGTNIDDQKREWITYRRFSEFNDLDLTIRKRYPDLRDTILLPNKSLLNNTSPEVRLKRQKELNDYLSVKINIFSFLIIKKSHLEIN
jgi:hypothetical protein